jgi:hypothetical protein
MSDYPEKTVLRLIKHIPVIIRNFQLGMNIAVIAQQMQCTSEIIEEIIRLGFKAKFKIVTLDNEDELDS